MKHLLTLCLLAVTMCAVAQNKKIALLEPREGEGSTEISGMEKAMVRGELRKAIVNHTGYEAFTRADVDQLMKEQDFQRTGLVDDSQVKQLGEMSGADYICISTLNKSNTEFYLEAYLINVETGGISNPASQYGELIGGKLSNMLPVCQALAQELLGTYLPIVDQPAIHSKDKQTTSVPEPVVQKTHTQEKPVTDKTEIGSLYVFPDGTKGIVFYKDANGHGLVVSLDESVLQWDSHTKHRSIVNIVALPDIERVDSYITLGRGLEYSNAIMNENSGYCPAVTWCKQLGEGWYLPCAEELIYLLKEANGASSERGIISQQLLTNGGIPISDKWFWSSTENDDDEAINVRTSGWSSSEDKDSALPVRAVRMF